MAQQRVIIKKDIIKNKHARQPGRKMKKKEKEGKKRRMKIGLAQRILGEF